MAQNRIPNLGDLANLGRGLLMGGADIIPGVSGGTMALILGIYERLVTAISHFDLTLLRHLRGRRWQSAVEHFDLRFLIALGSGILIGIGGLASLMHHLLEHYALPTWSLLFGLIVASAWLVGMMVNRWTPAAIIGAFAGAGFAFWLVGQLPAVPPEGYGYLFFCGMVAICAMILPGISGAFILVILGMYFHVTGVLKDFLHGNLSLANFLTIFVFVSGCAVGLLSFSKLLRWLLARHGTVTMAVLCGFMAGSLRKIWPFKEDATLQYLDQLPLSAERLAALRASPELVAELDERLRIYRNVLPDGLTNEVVLAIAVAAVSAAVVILLDYLTRGPRHDATLRAADHEPDPTVG
jgi:putative membrane protein